MSHIGYGVGGQSEGSGHNKIYVEIKNYFSRQEEEKWLII